MVGVVALTRVYLERSTGLAGDLTAPDALHFDDMVHPFSDVTDRPPFAITNRIRQIAITGEETRVAAPAQVAKPPYRVPTMAEIGELEPNGFSAASTFSGCGGSSLGYRMAGFRMLWASEFVEAARDTYRANAAPYTVLDGRDIREVTPTDVLAGAGVACGELDLMDGSPPCSSFSTAGSRHKAWGQSKKYSDREQRTDDLFFEYARLLDGVQPRCFVAENVSGLVKGSAKGYFKQILAALTACGPGYNVSARVLDAAWLGVPQARQRLIFVGVRRDLELPPVHPSPLPYRYTVRDALPWITGQMRGAGFGEGGMAPPDQPSQTIGTHVYSGNGSHPASEIEARVAVHGDTRSVDEPAPTVLTHGRLHTRSELGIESPPIFARQGRGEPGPVDVDRPAPTVMAHGIGGQDDTQTAVVDLEPARDAAGRAIDPETAHPIGLEGYKVVKAWDARRGVTAPVERRRFTLGELRAICGFPPDFVLTGNYSQRWERLGRAVPPVMMSYIAAALRDRVLVPAREQGRI